MLNVQILLSGGAMLETFVQDSQIRHGVATPKPAMIICPGGAYLVLATRESEPVAVEFMARGFQCFVLRYSVGIDRDDPDRPLNLHIPYPTQVLQLMEAVHAVRERADEWHVDASRLYVMGFSAGGHVAASLATRWNDPELLARLPFDAKPEDVRPTAAILGFPMLRLNDEAFDARYDERSMQQMRTLNLVLLGSLGPSPERAATVDTVRYAGPQTVPTFLWNCADDTLVDCRAALEYARALVDAGVSCEYHLFSRGGHGQPLFNVLTTAEDEREDAAIATWPDFAVAWLESLG